MLTGQGCWPVLQPVTRGQSECWDYSSVGLSRSFYTAVKFTLVDVSIFVSIAAGCTFSASNQRLTFLSTIKKNKIKNMYEHNKSGFLQSQPAGSCSSGYEGWTGKIDRDWNRRTLAEQKSRNLFANIFTVVQTRSHGGTVCSQFKYLVRRTIRNQRLEI